MRHLFFSIIVLPFLISCTQTKTENTETYQAGFKTIRTIDPSRVYKKDTDSTDYLHTRPLDIDIWYPAVANNDSALLFRNILGLLESRANYYTASNAGNGLTNQLAQVYCDGFKCSDTTSLLNYRTESYKDTKPVDKKFPLVIYLSAFNGMSYENYSLFETLAKNGFIVVSISSIGRYPGDMTMKKEDLMEQVFDAVASIKHLKQNANIDFENVGIIGYSWGVLASPFVANMIPNVKCLISFDGSEFHHYGESKEENRDFESIKNSNEFRKISLPMPYLRLESSQIAGKAVKDSVYNFSKKLSGDVTILRVDSAQHEDFGCLSEIIVKSGNCKSNRRFETIEKLTLSFLSDNLLKKDSFSESLKRELNKTVKKK